MRGIKCVLLSIAVLLIGISLSLTANYGIPPRWFIYVSVASPAVALIPLVIGCILKE